MTYHIITPPKFSCPTTPVMTDSSCDGGIYPDPAAEVDAGTPTKIFTSLLGEELAQFCQVS